MERCVLGFDQISPLNMFLLLVRYYQNRQAVLGITGVNGLKELLQCQAFSLDLYAGDG